MAFVSALMDWLISLITGVLGSIIASIVLAFCGWRLIHRMREAKIDIKNSKVKGDVIGGDKRGNIDQANNSVEKRISYIKIRNSELSGDVIAGNKEK